MQHPHDGEAEAALISAAMHRGADAVHEIVEVVRDPSAFFVPSHRAVWTAILGVADAGGAIELRAIVHELERANAMSIVGGVNSLEAYTRAPCTDTDRFARSVKLTHQKRTLALALREASEAVYGDADISTAIARGRRALDKIDEEQAQLVVPMAVAVAEARQMMEHRVEGREILVPLPFETLNLLLGGGLAPGDLFVLGASSGQGKTAMFMNIAKNCTMHRPDPRSRYVPRQDPIPVLLCSGEMAIVRLVMRWVSDMTGINGLALRSPDREWLFGKDASESHNRATLLDFAFDTLTNVEISMTRPKDVGDLDEIAAAARSWRARMRRQYGNDVAGVVGVDFLQLMGPSSTFARNMRPDQVEGEKARFLKKLAQELGVPVIALSQLNDGPEQRAEVGRDPRPKLKDLSGAKAIKFHADQVGFLFRPWAYANDVADLEAEFQELRVARNRGTLGASRQRFAELAAARGHAEFGFVKARDGQPNVWRNLLFKPELTRFLDAGMHDGGRG